MKLLIDTVAKSLIFQDKGADIHLELYSKQAFELLSHIWLKVGWNQKYVYTFTWMGRPIIQLPEDMIRVQEVIYKTQPDVIIETGIAHGGSLIFYASLCNVLGKGRVIGIDNEIRPQNRAAIESHNLHPLITLIEGNSVDKNTIKRVGELIAADESVFIVLDSKHSKSHVLKELEAYHTFVTPDSYIIATDGIMRDLFDTPRGQTEWVSDNPSAAVLDFLKRHPEFVLEKPVWLFNESELSENVTHWQDAWLRRK